MYMYKAECTSDFLYVTGCRTLHKHILAGGDIV